MDGTRPSLLASAQLHRSSADQIPRDLAIDAVVVYFSQLGAPMYTHERITLCEVAETIARIKDCRFAGVCAATEYSTRNSFFDPDDTLMLDEARALGSAPTLRRGRAMFSRKDQSHHASLGKRAGSATARLVTGFRT
jgi:hypothetical protein